MWTPVFSSILSCVFAGWFLRLGPMSRKLSGWTNFKWTNSWILTAWITVTICINFLCVLFFRADGKWQHIHTIYNFDFSHLWNFQQFKQYYFQQSYPQLCMIYYDLLCMVLFRPLTRFLSTTLLPISSSDDTADLSCRFFRSAACSLIRLLTRFNSFLHPIVMKLNPFIRTNASITWGIKYIIHW